MIMRKDEIINGYRILEDFKVAGGMSKISFAERGGKEFFIKEFLYPKYPTPDSPGSERTKAQKRKACEAFEKHHRELNSLIATKVSLGGNLVYAIDFFREGSAYYKVNEKIDTSSLSLKEISSLPEKSINIIARSVCHSVGILHDLGIVHGDLKPENILIKQTMRDAFTGKLIDFDDSYFTQRPPADRECIVGTPEYYSPELAAYLMDEDEEISGETLTLASDVFTLGIILCEYFTGEKPKSGTDMPTWLAVEKGKDLSFEKSLNPEIESMLRSMLAKTPTDRPTIKKVQNTLREVKDGKGSGTSPTPTPIPTKTGHVGLRGKGLEVAPLPSTKDIPKKPEEDSVKIEVPKKVGLRGKGLNIKD